MSANNDTQVVLLAETQFVGNPLSTEDHSLGEFTFAKRKRRTVRSQNSILLAILEACRTPTVQHWIMVKARLGYDTFWKHMNLLMANGMMEKSSDGYKTLYSVNQKGLEYLRDLEAIQQ